MSYGFFVQNDAGRVQVDENYRNLLLVASGQLSGAGTITFPEQTTCAPLVMIRHTADGKHAAIFTLTSTSAYIWTDGITDWAVYGLDSPVLDASDYGLEVFDSSGALTFTTRAEPLRLRTVIDVDMPWPDSFITLDPADDPAYPYTPSFTGWGVRPWISLNEATWLADDYATTWAVGGISASQISVRCGTFLFGAWQWAANDGGSPAPARSYALGRMRIMLAQRAG